MGWRQFRKMVAKVLSVALLAGTIAMPLASAPVSAEPQAAPPWPTEAWLEASMDGDIFLEWSEYSVTEATYYRIYENGTLVDTVPGSRLDTFVTPDDSGLDLFEVRAETSDGAMTASGPQVYVEDLLTLDGSVESWDDAHVVAATPMVNNVYLSWEPLEAPGYITAWYRVFRDMGGYFALAALTPTPGVMLQDEPEGDWTYKVDAVVDRNDASGRFETTDGPSATATVGGSFGGGEDPVLGAVSFADAALAADVRQELGLEADAVILLSELKTIETLYVSTVVEDLSGLEYATGLKQLYLTDSAVSGLSPLVQNASFKDDDTSDQMKVELFLQGTPLDLTEGSQNRQDIETLRNRGVIVYHNALPPADTQAPSWDMIEGLTFPEISSTSITLQWPSAVDNVGIAGYRVTRDGVETHEVDAASRSYTFGNLTEGSEYTFTVQARDAAGNWSGPLSAAATARNVVAVNIPDPELAWEIRWRLNKTDDSVPVTSEDMLKLTMLDLYDYGITDLTGLEYATNLTTLELDWNPGITDYSPLRTLKKLTELSIRGSGIADISWISELTALRDVDLEDNNIVDTTPLNTLTQLEDLSLYGNAIVAPSIQNLNSLMYLDLGDNAITNITGLIGLPSLIELDLSYNQLTDAQFTGMAQLYELDLSYNQLGTVSITNLPSLRYLELYENDLSAPVISGLPALRSLELENNQIHDLSGVTSLPSLNYLYLDGNKLTELPSPALFPELVVLSASGNLLTNVTVQGFASLYRLDLSDNELVNVASSSSLADLEDLDLSGNALTSLPDLSGLSALNELYLSGNELTTLSMPMLPSLEYLYVDNNELTSLHVSEVPELYDLDVSGNRLTSLSVEGLTNLQYLYAASNQLSSLEWLAGNATIRELDLSHNQIADITPLGTTKAHRLYLANNLIADLQPLLALRENGGLPIGEYRRVDVRGNPLGIVYHLDSQNMVVIATLQETGVYVMFDVQYAEELILKQTKGIVGPGEYFETVLAKATADHDVSEFRFVLLLNPYLWEAFGISPADGLADILTLDWVTEGPAVILTGTFEPGHEPAGLTDLVKIHLKAKEVIGGYPGIDLDGESHDRAYSEGGYPGDVPPLFPAFVMLQAGTTDSGDILRNANPEIFGYVGFASPDVDGDGDVDLTDVELVSAAFGTREEDAANEELFYRMDKNGNGVIDMADLSFVYMRATNPGYDPNEPGDDVQWVDYQFEDYYPGPV